MRNLNGIITVTQAAEVLGVSRQRAAQLIIRHNVPTAQIGSQLVLEQADLARIPSRRMPGRPREYPERRTRKKVDRP